MGQRSLYSHMVVLLGVPAMPAPVRFTIIPLVCVGILFLSAAQVELFPLVLASGENPHAIPIVNFWASQGGCRVREGKQIRSRNPLFTLQAHLVQGTIGFWLNGSMVYCLLRFLLARLFGTGEKEVY